MTSSACLVKLNELLIRLDRSLLQYVGESWPWIDAESQETLDEFNGLIKRQKNDVARLVQVLISNRWAIDFSNYPTDFTDKQFLSLNFLFPQIISVEKFSKSICDETLSCCRDDEAIADLLKQIAANQADGIARLENLLKNRKTAAIASV
ncbi:MAG: hypothetical protein O2955_12800 [Planctomycetota bacterium]|nr:hypothetical protein [Planctomycetota bacterium]MDA1213387.1 hypothetical protein [Planctomycetota bacterium]